MRVESGGERTRCYGRRIIDVGHDFRKEEKKKGWDSARTRASADGLSISGRENRAHFRGRTRLGKTNWRECVGECGHEYLRRHKQAPEFNRDR